MSIPQYFNMLMIYGLLRGFPFVRDFRQEFITVLSILVDLLFLTNLIRLLVR